VFPICLFRTGLRGEFTMITVVDPLRSFLLLIAIAMAEVPTPISPPSQPSVLKPFLYA